MKGEAEMGDDRANKSTSDPRWALSQEQKDSVFADVRRHLAALSRPVPEFHPLLTMEQYMDATAFPLTSLSEHGTNLDAQFESDAVAFRELRDHLAAGGNLTRTRQEKLIELMRKIPSLPVLWRQIHPGLGEAGR